MNKLKEIRDNIIKTELYLKDEYHPEGERIQNLSDMEIDGLLILCQTATAKYILDEVEKWNNENYLGQMILIELDKFTDSLRSGIGGEQ